LQIICGSRVELGVAFDFEFDLIFLKFKFWKIKYYNFHAHFNNK
jgi:hypothetical protein